MKHILIATTSILILTGCSSISLPEREGPQVSDSLPAVPESWAAAQERVGDVKVGWIASFNDPVLERLVEEAQANNKNLQIAAANVEQSRALARQAGAALVPSVSGSVGASEAGVLENGNSQTGYSAGLQVNWELDLWGRIRSGQQAAVASAQAADADYVFSQYSVAGGVASAYFIAIEAGLQEAVAQRSYDALAETVRIVSVQYENGLASAQDLALARSDLATAEDAVTSANGGKRDALRALEVLLGRYPEADLAVRDSLPAVPAVPGAGVPSELLERRPDIIAAERRVAAAFNNLNAAKAATLPSISLTGSLGGSSNSLSNLLDPTNVAWQAASNLVTPIIDGGAREAQVEASTASQKQAVAAYAQAALDAFLDVETSLDQGTVLTKRNVSLEEAVTQANEAYRIANLQYLEGETSLVDVLSIQQRVFTAESNFVSVQRLLLEQRVSLNLALGGSWQ